MYEVHDMIFFCGFDAFFFVYNYTYIALLKSGILVMETDRLAGVTLIAPVVNYWWPGFPSDISSKAFYQQFPQDQWSLRVSHHIPWLTYWWNTQKWFPFLTLIAQSPGVLSRQDSELVSVFSTAERKKYEVYIMTFLLHFNLVNILSGI